MIETVRKLEIGRVGDAQNGVQRHVSAFWRGERVR